MVSDSAPQRTQVLSCAQCRSHKLCAVAMYPEIVCQMKCFSFLGALIFYVAFFIFSSVVLGSDTSVCRGRVRTDLLDKLTLFCFFSLEHFQSHYSFIPKGNKNRFSL